MKRYTDFVALFMLKGEHYDIMHIDARPGNRWPVYTVRYGKDVYNLAVEKAHLIKGWYPWVRFNWRNPFTMPKYLALRYFRKVGVIFYAVGNPEPQHISNKDPDKAFEIISPQTLRAIALSPVYRRYQSKSQFGPASVNHTLIYVMVAAAALIIALYVTGNLHFGASL